MQAVIILPLQEGSNKKTPPFHVERGCFLAIFFRLGVFDARLGHIDLELVVSHGIVIEHTDRLIGISLRGHGYKGKAFRRAGALFGGNIHRGDGSSLREQGLDFILCGRLVQVSYINSSFHIFLLSPAQPEIKMTATL